MADLLGTEQTISYTVKELLGKLDSKLDAVVLAVKDAPTRTEFAEVEKNVALLMEDRAKRDAVAHTVKSAVDDHARMMVLKLMGAQLGMAIIVLVATHLWR